MTAKKKECKKVGRPTKYKEEYCQAIVDYFDVSPVDENGDAIDLLFLSAFARKIGVNQDTLHEWASVHPNFSEAYKTAKKLQQEMMINNTLQNRYNASFAWRAMMNMHGWRDRSDNVHTGKGGGPIEVAKMDMSSLNAALAKKDE